MKSSSLHECCLYLVNGQACAYVCLLGSRVLASTDEVLPMSLAALQAVHWNEDEVYRFLLAFSGQPGDALQAAAASDELKARFKRSRWAAPACSCEPILLLLLTHQSGPAGAAGT